MSTYRISRTWLAGAKRYTYHLRISIVTMCRVRGIQLLGECVMNQEDTTNEEFGLVHAFIDYKTRRPTGSKCNRTSLMNQPRCPR